MRPIEFNSISEKSLRLWVLIFIILHIFLWSLAPILVRYCLPMDALEGTTWGQQLEWGYDKNPFMNAWLTALAVKISHSHDWMIYFFSQLSVGISFLSVWALGKKITSVTNTFIAVVLLACLQYYNLHAIDFNDNTLELGLWGLSVLYFYKALQEEHLSNWILLGLFAALSLMTKYFVITLFFPMLILMLVFPNTRQQFNKWGVYIGLLVFTLISLPHFVWLFQNNFITLNYAVNRVSSEPHFSNHFFYPAQFLWQQFEVILPSLILLGTFWFRNLRSSQRADNTIFDKYFLLFMAVGPLITTLLLSAVTGMKLRAGWGQPLFTFLPLCLLVWFNPLITKKRIKFFSMASLTVIFSMLMGYCIAIIKANEPSSANFPGKIIADSLEMEWKNRFHTPLKYVVGARWISGNIAYYSHDKPRVFIDADKHISPWINERDLFVHGGLFIWDPTEQHQMQLDKIKKRYPKLENITLRRFNWLRNHDMKPIEISVAILPPQVVG